MGLRHLGAHRLAGLPPTFVPDTRKGRDHEEDGERRHAYQETHSILITVKETPDVEKEDEHVRCGHE
jgi:hypothetical protein